MVVVVELLVVAVIIKSNGTMEKDSWAYDARGRSPHLDRLFRFVGYARRAHVCVRVCACVCVGVWYVRVCKRVNCAIGGYIYGGAKVR